MALEQINHCLLTNHFPFPHIRRSVPPLIKTKTAQTLLFCEAEESFLSGIKKFWCPNAYTQLSCSRSPVTMITSRTCLLLFTIQLIYAVSAQEMEKRVPQGFVGMRGKKFEEPTEQFYKRKPQFFVGVKGKKSIFELLEDPEEKRVPMGFVGMRGKKETYLPSLFDPEGSEYVPKRGGSLIGQIDYASSDELKNYNSQEFPILNEILFKYLEKMGKSNTLESAPELAQETDNELSNERVSNELDKRAANIHQFFGVRGKKSVQIKRPYDLSFRGKFIGVRGKKDLKNSAQEIRFLLGPNGPWPKRKAQMGFVGMRGKKWLSGMYCCITN